MKKQYDVVIIGAGVVGSAIARELSRYKLSIAVLEKNLDVCNETSGRNSAVVHGGFANPIGSLKAKCCVEGNRIMDQLAEELNFPFKRCGKVLVGNTPEDMEQLERTMKQGAVNGCTGLEMIDEAKLHELVPAVVGKFAMWSKNSGIMDPFLYTVALAENAHANSVDFFFDHKVEAITRENELYYLHTAHGDFCTRWVVNAAGLGAKQISDLLGLTGYRVIGSRSNYIILHKRMGKLLPMPVYPVPSNTYMGIHITPTVDGNVTVGPDAENTDVLDDYSVPQANMDSLAVEGAKLWPHIFKRIRSAPSPASSPSGWMKTVPFRTGRWRSGTTWHPMPSTSWALNPRA
ncbi:NAD(P)/FAD-dependent oxidoreductase [Faecalibacterium taiwanense]|uniref:NAD(P)/FAD-dependent oxidoreductase n=1 Tax=Faecalibacterium taiwanense TaxID=3030638 RepID=UPI00321B9ECB